MNIERRVSLIKVIKVMRWLLKEMGRDYSLSISKQLALRYLAEEERENIEWRQ